MTGELDGLAGAFAEFHARFAPYFYRAEVRERSRRYLRALLAPVERKNGWQLAEAMGEADPNGAQRLLYAAVWPEAAVQRELARFVWEHFGDPLWGIFLLDETGFLKKGTESVGVQRQYSGTAGKRENCQVGVLLAYTSPLGTAFLDRRLYLPEVWAEDPARREKAGVPESAAFQTKPQLARAMWAEARALGLRAGWVAADEVYGADEALRAALEAGEQAYVLAVRRNELLLTGGSPDWPLRADEAAASLAAGDWRRLSVAEGSKGPRLYDWAAVALAEPAPEGMGHHLLVRRSLTDPDEVAYYRVCAPAGTGPADWARVAGARWAIEQAIEEAKGEAGLDHYEVRSWQSWHRHLTLSLLAHAFLARTRQQADAAARAAAGGEKGEAGPDPRLGRAERARDPALAPRDAAPATQLARIPPGLVRLAAPSPGDRPPLPLSPPRPPARALPANLNYLRL
jgi:SRSO17 transposase